MKVDVQKKSGSTEEILVFEPSQPMTVGNVKEYMLEKGYAKEDQKLYHSFYRFDGDETVLPVSEIELTIKPRGKETQHRRG